MLRLFTVLGLIAGATQLVACERDPIDIPCPAVGVGALVVSEIRGDQSDSDDTLGEWIEIYNTGQSAVDLLGARVVVTRLDGTSQAIILVRDSVVVDAGGYAVLGRFFQESRPSYVDYGYSLDFDSSLFDTGAIEIFACGERSDQLVYRNLPNSGTYNFGGELDPDASANDTDTNWCTDDAAEDAAGTPGERNNLCAAP